MTDSLILSLPQELIQDAILPLLQWGDVLALSGSCSFFWSLIKPVDEELEEEDGRLLVVIVGDLLRLDRAVCEVDQDVTERVERVSRQGAAVLKQSLQVTCLDVFPDFVSQISEPIVGRRRGLLRGEIGGEGGEREQRTVVLLNGLVHRSN